MACSKYTLTNTGSSIANFSYRRCDDNMWQYQVPLDPSEVKNIWLINNSYSTAFSNAIVLDDQGAFPPLNATATPTPTPTVTPTNTPTPSVTTTQTPTQTNTPSQTATQTQTNTPTNTQTSTETSTPTPTTTTTLTATQTPTETSTPTPTPTPFNYSFALGSGDTQNAACSATSTSLYTTRSQGPTIEVSDELYTDAALTSPAPDGYYSDGTTWYLVSGGNGEVSSKDDNGCLSLVTPTPTITNTATNTPTPSITPSATPIARYEFDNLCHSESTAEEACGCTGTATIFTNSPVFSASTLFWSDATGVNTGNPVGFYALDNIVYYVNDDCGIGCSTGSTLGFSSFCSVTPTPTPTQTQTQTPSGTPDNSPTPTNTQTGTPAVTPTTTTTPTASSFGTNTFRVEIVNAGRARDNSYSLTEIPYDTTPGSGFTASTGTFPITAGGVVFGTHQAFSSSVFNSITFEMECAIDGELSIVAFLNGSFLRAQGPYNLVSSGPNTITFSLSSDILVTDTLYFQLS